jgi:hypothetical protein
MAVTVSENMAILSGAASRRHPLIYIRKNVQVKPQRGAKKELGGKITAGYWEKK